jgi:hypothetical protein
MVEQEACTALMGVNVDVIDSVGGETVRSPDKAVYFITLGQQKLCQI